MSPPDGAINVDFAALANADEDFAKVYRANDGFIDFQDPQTVQQLTKSILKRDFNLGIELPDDRLCPPVPVRYEYIRWLQALVDTTSDEYTEEYDNERDVVGIDIGVGASCIYPLLGCASRPRWRFAGTEIDEKSLAWATKNVALNNLQSRIRLRRTQPDGPLLNLPALGVKHAEFVMCNPPFFTSKQDMLATNLTKKRSPSAVCTGAEVELVTEGGDLGFVLRLVEESEKLRDQVQWYSSMLGKLQSANEVVAKLKEKKISNWAVTSFQAGNITKRWAVAWSFDDLRPRNDVARGKLSTKEILPFPTEFKVSIPRSSQANSTSRINNVMKALDVKWTWDEDGLTGLCFARANVWSRSARRKKQREGTQPKENKDDGSDDDEKDPALGVRITLVTSEQEGRVTVRWLKGVGNVLFESFCGMLKRAMTMQGNE